MANQLNNAKVEMGRAIPVQNTNKARLATDKYYAIKLEDFSGEVENWFLFTRHEIDSFQRMDFDLASEMKRGRIYNCSKTESSEKLGSIKYLISIEFPDSEDQEYTLETIMIPAGVALKGMKRAEKNPEDIPSQSALSDLLD
jgi:hypothetical protein